MSVVIFELGAIVVLANYIEQKKNSAVWYYRRRVPQDVRNYYPNLSKRGEIFHSLKTKDPKEAARKAHKLATQQDSLWESVRGNVDLVGPETVEVAHAILDAHGLKPGQRAEYDAYDVEPDDFISTLRMEAGVHSVEDSRARPKWWREVSPEYQMAQDLFNGKKAPLFLSDVLVKFQELKGEDPTTKKGADRVRVVEDFIGLVGNLPILDYSREHANEYIHYLLTEKGNKTATVKRRLNGLRPVFKTVCREFELTDRQIFEGNHIPNLGEDSKDRLPFSNTELQTIWSACVQQDDDMRWIIALMIDTGMRLGEVVGLKVEDIILDAQNPYVVVKPNDARSLKTTGSARSVPLIGASLWAARSAIQSTKDDYAFPRYIDRSSDTPRAKSTHASNAINKWIQGVICSGVKKTAHSFRHSMQDRLRDAGVPEECRNAICGWSNKGIGAGYGEGFTVSLLAGHLRKVELMEGAVVLGDKVRQISN